MSSDERRPIVMLAHSYYPEDPRIRREAEALVGAGYRVVAVSLSKVGVSRRWVCQGVEVVETGLVKKRASLPRYALQYARTILACRREVSRLVREGRPLLIQVHTLPDFLIWATRPARRRGIPIILDLHESMPDFFASKYEREGDGKSIVFRILEHLERHCASWADRLLTVNDEIADAFQQRLGRRPHVIMNTVDERLFSRDTDAPPWPDGPKRLGYHGTLTQIYGLDLAIRAMAQVLEKHPMTTLHVYGDGPERRPLERLAREAGVEEAVIFHGRVPLDEMSRHLSSIHVGVVPTRKDAFLDMSLATKLLEYVYLGKPTVSSDLDAVQRCFPGETTLAYFHGNEIDSLAETICSVLSWTGEEASERVRRARERYAQIRWPIMAERYLRVIEEMTGESS